jgi:hypothetical protein
MEEAYGRKAAEIGPEFQVVFHGTEERSNVESILRRVVAMATGGLGTAGKALTGRT